MLLLGHHRKLWHSFLYINNSFNLFFTSINALHSTCHRSLCGKVLKISNKSQVYGISKKYLNTHFTTTCLQIFLQSSFSIIQQSLTSSNSLLKRKLLLCHSKPQLSTSTMSPSESPSKRCLLSAKSNLRQKNAQNSHPITICVEGNIGSGKTTLLNQLSARPDVEVLQEPVEKWRNVKGKNLLDLMYLDPLRWSHLFQSYVQLTMVQMHMKPCHAKVKIMERSIHSARYCFVENMFRTGRMSEPEYNVICEWYNTINCNLFLPVDLIVYLSASPTLAQERIIKRGRAEEANIPISYLSELHALHCYWLQNEDLPAPVLVLDAELTLEQMTARVEEHLEVLLQQRAEAEKSFEFSRSPAKKLSSPSASPAKLTVSLRPASASN
ncbi:deoxynucleoside kinase [Hyalella azteca]|uniref:Deoxynucleoside kinase n=1 Tax=Hyalella azteca TaxID=294128 RepID=A0A8B7N2K1_HYAAZ|nr:deoxynucleoside kinase [Hyalella azteca]